MKVVIYCYKTKQEFERVMNIVKNVGTIIEDKNKNNLHDYIQNDIDNIYIEYKNILYKFNRYDPIFIEKVEEAIRTNPYSHSPGITYEGHLCIFEIDDRFTNKKYYTITKNLKFENIEIHTELIIDDLYNNVYVFTHN